jgi:hypothetical protein
MEPMLRATHPLAVLLLRALVLVLWWRCRCDACVQPQPQRGLRASLGLGRARHARDLHSRQGHAQSVRITFFSFLFFLSHLSFCFLFLVRAVHGDSVAVELLPESEWSAPSSVVKHDYDDDEEENMEGGTHNHTSVCLPS